MKRGEQKLGFVFARATMGLVLQIYERKALRKNSISPFLSGGSRGISARLAVCIRACFSAACLILFFAVAIPAFADDPAKISPRDLQPLIGSKSVMLINVMSILECHDHQIPGSICIPCEDLGKQAPQLLKNKPERIVVYGDRADDAANCQAVLQALAGQNVSILDGGLEAWKKAGYQSVSLEHIPRLPVPAIRPQALKALTGTGKPVLILDIRPGSCSGSAISREP